MKRNPLKITFSALLLILALLLCSMTALAENYSAVVTSKTAAVYSDSAMKHKIGSLNKSTVVTVTDTVKKAARIKVGSNVGYMKAASLKAVSKVSKPATINQTTKIYRESNTYSASTSIQKGISVNVLSTQGLWAMVERNGSVGYILLNCITYNGTDKPAATASPTSNYTATASVTKMYVYKKNSTSSTCLGYVPKGKSFTVVKQSGAWAYITLNGHTGYAKLDQMTKGGTVSNNTGNSVSNVPSSSWRIYLKDTSISVEKRIAMYLMQEMKLSAAATSAILASVERECSFHVDIGSYDGGYGIVQWTGSRNRRMKDWCKDNGYDHRTLIAQMRFLDYELNKYYPKILKKMKEFPNTAQGAYDAGYYFCYNFEIPANRTNSSKIRGNLAKNKYFPKYSK